MTDYRTIRYAFWNSSIFHTRFILNSPKDAKSGLCLATVFCSRHHIRHPTATSSYFSHLPKSTKTMFDPRKTQSLLSCFFMLLVGSQAHSAQSGLFTYEVVDGKVHITAYPAEETGHLDIPAQLDGIPVTAITGTGGKGAFEGSRLDSVTIPEGVETIGDSSFYRSSVITVTFPGTLRSIGEQAFAVGSVGFRNVPLLLPDGLEEIGARAFFACDFTEIVIPDSVTAIGAEAFANCIQMVFAEIGSGVAVLSDGAFAKCTVLERVQLVEGLMEIGEDCFMNTQIAEVTFPATLTTIGSNAFGFEFSFSLNGGTLLRAIFNGDAPAVMGENVFADQASEFVVNYLVSSSGFTQPMWRGNRSHEVAVLPSDTLEQEGDFTYRVIDDEVEIVGFPKNFAGHVEIPAMIAGKPVTGITGAYRGNDFEAAFEFAALTSVTIPEGVEVVGSNNFGLCFGLKEVSFPDSLKIIGPAAFYRTMIDKLELGSGLEVIGEFAFPNLEATGLALPDSLKKVGTRAFERHKARSLIVGPSLESVGDLFAGNLEAILFKGNAPTEASVLFRLSRLSPDEGLTIYYLAGAQGFTSPTWDAKGDGSLVVNTVEIGVLKPVKEWLITKGFEPDQDMNQTLAGSQVPILTAYALKLNSHEGSVATMPLAEVTGDHLEMTFFGGRSDVSYKVEASDDLAVWNEDGVTVSATDPQGMRTARVPGGSSRKFMRLVFSLSE